MRGQEPKGPKKRFSFFGKTKKEGNTSPEADTEVNASQLYPSMLPQDEQNRMVIADLDPSVILSPPGPRVLMGTEPRTGTHHSKATAGELGMYTVMTDRAPLAKRAHVIINNAPLAVDTDLSNAVIVSGGKDSLLR